MTKTCIYPIRTCRECNYYFKKADHNLSTCPNCFVERSLCGKPVIGTQDYCDPHLHKHVNMTPVERMSHVRYMTPKVPKQIAEKYLKYSQDRDRLNNEPTIDMIDARIEELVEQQDYRHSDRLYFDLRKAWQDFIDATNLPEWDKGKPKKLHETTTELNHLIMEGYNAATHWQEIDRWINTRIKVSTSEVRRRKTAHDMISQDRFDLMVAMILEILMKKISNQDLFDDIVVDMEKIFELKK